MLTSFHVKNFRGLSDLTIEPLDRVNLIAGKNNTGKTSLLEALYLHCNPDDPKAAVDVNNFRNLAADSPSSQLIRELCNWLVHQESDAQPTFFSSFDSDQIERHLSLRLTDPRKDDSRFSHAAKLVGEVSPQLLERYYSSEFAIVFGYGQTGNFAGAEESVGFTAPSQVSFIRVQATLSWKPVVQYLGFGRTIFDGEVDLFSELDASNRQGEILDPLRLLEPNLRRLSILLFNGKPMIHGDIGLPRLMPIPFMGEGFRRLLAIVLGIANARGGFLLIDEIDAGLHHSILPKVFEAVGQAARAADVQVFATTHSYECIMAAHRAFAEHEPYDLRLHRLERVDGQVRAITYDQETLETSEEMMLEVR